MKQKRRMGVSPESLINAMSPEFGKQCAKVRLSSGGHSFSQCTTVMYINFLLQRKVLYTSYTPTLSALFLGDPLLRRNGTTAWTGNI